MSGKFPAVAAAKIRTRQKWISKANMGPVIRTSVLDKFHKASKRKASNDELDQITQEKKKKKKSIKY